MINALFIFGIIILVWMLIVNRAPEGWEDDEGFHYGRKS